VFSDQNMFSLSQGEALLDKQEETLNQLVKRFPPPPVPSSSMTMGGGGGGRRSDSWSSYESTKEAEGSVSGLSASQGSVYVLWHTVALAEEWLSAIQSLSLPHFTAMLGQPLSHSVTLCLYLSLSLSLTLPLSV
jgi:hypothetical protein